MASTAGKLQGLVAVITGAASGIGRSTAKKFVEDGAKVIIADRQVELGEATAKELGSDATFIKCDVTKEADVAAAVDLAVSQHGQLDIMFNNAGIVGERGPIDQAHVEDFDFTLAVNLRSVFLGTKHAARVMKERKSGCILNTASVAAIGGGIGPHGYTASKAAILGMTRSTAAELRPHHIRVNCILPGGVVTPLMDGVQKAMQVSPEEFKEIMAGKMGFGGNVINPEDIANTAAFLASRDAYFITGQPIKVDAGLTDLYSESLQLWFGGRQEVLREGGQLGHPTED